MVVEDAETVFINVVAVVVAATFVSWYRNDFKKALVSVSFIFRFLIVSD